MCSENISLDVEREANKTQPISITVNTAHKVSKRYAGALLNLLRAEPCLCLKLRTTATCYFSLYVSMSSLATILFVVKNTVTTINIITTPMAAPAPVSRTVIAEDEEPNTNSYI